MRTPHDIITDLQSRSALNILSGRTPEGARPAPALDAVREVVTQLEPLMSRPVSGGPPAAVQWTESVRGVQVSDVILVQTQGVARRTAVGLGVPKPLAQQHQGDRVGSINGQDLSVGGGVQLDATDVGALPDTVRAEDIGGMPADADIGLQSHTHSMSGTVNIPSSSCSVTMPDVSITRDASYTSGVPGGYDADWAWHITRMVYDIRARLNYMAGLGASCTGCGRSGSVSISGTTGSAGSGGGYTPDPGDPYTPPPTQRSVHIGISAPAWRDMGSPSSWSSAWAEDVRDSIYRLYNAVAQLVNSTHSVSTGGTITLTYGPEVWVSDVGGAGPYTRYWSEEIQGDLLRLSDALNSISGTTYSVQGGSGSITIATSDAPWNNVGIPDNFSQPYAASVRLQLSRLYTLAGQIMGKTFTG